MREMCFIQAVMFIASLLMAITAGISMFFNPLHILFFIGFSVLTYTIKKEKSW